MTREEIIAAYCRSHTEEIIEQYGSQYSRAYYHAHPEAIIEAYYTAHPGLKASVSKVNEPLRYGAPKKQPQKYGTPKNSAAKPVSAESWPLSKVIGAIFTSVMIGLSIALIILTFVR